MKKGSLIILVASLVFVALVFHSLVDVQPVHVLASRLERDDGKIFVVGKVKNTSSHPVGIDLEVHYYAKNGQRLGQDTISLNNLKAGEVAPFRSPPRALPGAAEFSLYLNHGRNPYGN
jgi:hypothetical protein